MLFGKIEYLNLLPFHLFMKRYHRNNSEDVGLDLNREQMAVHFDIIESRKPYHISDSIIFLDDYIDEIEQKPNMNKK